MKKITLLTIASCCLALFSQAQFTKGTVFLGGNLSYGYGERKSGTTPDASQHGLVISPVVGTAIKNDWVLALHLVYLNTKTKLANLPGEPYSHSYGAGILLRKYHPLGGRFYLFGEGALDGRRDNSFSIDGVDNSTTVRSTSFALSARPGVAYALSRRLHLEAGLGSLFTASYYHSHTEQSFIGGPSFSDQNGFSINTDLSDFGNLTVGFRLLL